MRRSFAMPKLVAGVLQIPCSGLAQFLHDLKSTALLMLKIASCTCTPFGVKTWCDQRCQRPNAINVGRSARIACIVTRVRSASMMHCTLHLQLLQSLLVLFGRRMLLLNVQPTLLYPLRTQVFGVFTAGVNTSTNQGTIDMWDYSLHAAIANLNSSFALHARNARNKFYYPWGYIYIRVAVRAAKCSENRMSNDENMGENAKSEGGAVKTARETTKTWGRTPKVRRVQRKPHEKRRKPGGERQK